MSSKTSNSVSVSSIVSGTIATTITIQDKEITIEVPSANDNPFLQTSNFKQGTLYAIIFPIIAALIIFYIAGVVINKIKAGKQAKMVEPFDKEYEFIEYRKNFDDIHNDDDNNYNNNSNYHHHDNPFDDIYQNESRSFTHKRATSSVDFISQYRRSMDHLTGVSDIINGKEDLKFQINQHSRNRNQSVGSTLQLNFNQQPQLNPESFKNSNTNILSPVSYSVENHGDNNDNLNENTSFYSISEPSKAFTSSTVNMPNNKTHFHTRTLSSHILDEFISTGELISLPEQPRTLNDIAVSNGERDDSLMMNNNASVESHSMFENSFNDVYNIPQSDSTIRHSITRSPSPRRHNQVRIPRQQESRSPSRSPTRSPTRGTLNKLV